MFFRKSFSKTNKTNWRSRQKIFEGLKSLRPAEEKLTTEDSIVKVRLNEEAKKETKNTKETEKSWREEI